MKITRLLPKSLALEYQQYDLEKTKAKLEYHKSWVQFFEQRYREGIEELNRLESK